MVPCALLGESLLDLHPNRRERLQSTRCPLLDPYEMQAVTRWDRSLPATRCKCKHRMSELGAEALAHARLIDLGRSGTQGKGIALNQSVALPSRRPRDNERQVSRRPLEILAVTFPAEEDLRETDARRLHPAIAVLCMERAQLVVGRRTFGPRLAGEQLHLLDQCATDHGILLVEAKGMRLLDHLPGLRRVPLARDKFHVVKEAGTHCGVEPMQPETPGFAEEKLLIDITLDRRSKACPAEIDPKVAPPAGSKCKDISNSQDERLRERKFGPGGAIPEGHQSEDDAADREEAKGRGPHQAPRPLPPHRDRAGSVSPHAGLRRGGGQKSFLPSLAQRRVCLDVQASPTDTSSVSICSTRSAEPRSRPIA